ncbi:MAG TPA: hypothetical protein VFV33_25245 [Gemmatimonadaceae bacterium]|nr:hypothetical protein [Gemmatimonadaceae bacterium]
MNGKTWCQLSLGLLGLWVLSQAIALFSFMMSYLVNFGAGASGVSAVVNLLPAFLLLGLSYVLVVRGDAVAERFFPGVVTAPEGATPAIGAGAIGMVGLLLVGVAIPPCIRAVYPFLQPESLERHQAISRWFDLAASVAQLAFGGWLARRPQDVLRLWAVETPETD